jgi:hypothetical protein
MKLRARKVFVRKARSRAGEDNEGFQNSNTALHPLLPSIGTFCSTATTLLHSQSAVLTAAAAA